MIPKIVQLTEKLKSRVDTKRIALEYPDAQTVSVLPTAADTYSITASLEDGKWFVSAERWRSQYDTINDVSSLICWLLTPYYRVVESKRNGDLLATWIEVYTNEGWESADHNYFVDPELLESQETGPNEMSIIHQAVFLDSAFPSHFPGAHLDQAGYPIGTLVGRTSYEFRGDGWYPVGVPVAE